MDSDFVCHDAQTCAIATGESRPIVLGDLCCGKSATTRFDRARLCLPSQLNKRGAGFYPH